MAPRNGSPTTASTTRFRCPPTSGTGLGKPLQLINHPVRERIPITIAALGPKNVELTAEIAEGWQPVFFYPEKADDVWGESLRAGYRQARSGTGAARHHGQRTAGHRRRRRRPIGLGETAIGALHRRHGCPRPELLPQPGDPLRVRRGGRPHPGSLPRRQEGRGDRGGARRTGAARFAGRARADTSRSASPPTPRPERPRCCCNRFPATARESVRFVEELQGLLP